jgi:DeoR/GlpR family transcriptional regulator of sugar metabolism
VNTHDRHTYLLKRLERDGALQVAGLDAELGVTAMTVWRDLRLLDERGLLKRVRGGAVSLERYETEPAFQMKEQHAAEEKRRIAAFAASKYVKSGDTIIVEGGTTAAEILKHLHAEKLALMTNSLPILSRAYALNKPWHLHASGGILSPVSGNFVGPEAIRYFVDKQADTFFMSATGLDVEAGAVTDPNPVEIEVKRVMAQCARQVVLLLDSSKVGIRSVQEVLKLERVTALITDSGMDNGVIKSLKKR